MSVLLFGTPFGVQPVISVQLPVTVRLKSCDGWGVREREGIDADIRSFAGVVRQIKPKSEAAIGRGAQVGDSESKLRPGRRISASSSARIRCTRVNIQELNREVSSWGRCR